MLFKLLSELRDSFGPLNVFRYTSFRIIAAMLSALIISFLLYPWLIRQLQRLNIGQQIREEMDEHHQAKKHTPTMGGSLIVMAIAVPTVLWADLSNQYVWLALAITVGFGIIGFVDDYRKVSKKDSKGLSGRQKLLFQFGLAIPAMWLLFQSGDYSTQLTFPFVDPNRFSLDLPLWAYVGFASIVIVGLSNACNLTDGLDGLASGPSIMAAGTFLVLAYAAGSSLGISTVIDGQAHTIYLDLAEYLKVAKVEGVQELAIFAGSMVGAGVGFLWFNTFPAQIFMGDVGSLSLGGGIGVMAVSTKQELLSGLICGIFVIEAISVIIQRYYYKATKKRVFLMAPIHHHFEKKNWSESQIVVRFWIIAMMLSLLALASLKLR